MSNELFERRFIPSFELRSTVSNGKRQISGYAATFNTPISKTMERVLGCSERIAPGAFKRAIQQRQDTICCQDHNPSLLMGRVSNGTLRLSEDSKGLKFSCDLPPTQAANDLSALINRGDVKGCSFSFVPNGKNGEAYSRKGDTVIRTLVDVDLYDVSCCALPAYDEGTEVDTNENSLQEIERALFPNGVPAELRSFMQHRRKSGIVSVRERMEMRLELSERL